MNVEAVTTCVGYGDFLAQTLRRNKHHFNRVVVVTSFDDAETIEVCRRNSVVCRPTDVHTRFNNDEFNKGRLIDFGLGYCRRDGWLVHLDADMVLPPDTRGWLERVQLDESCIYGIDRVLCVGWDAWQKFDASSHDFHDYHCRVHIPSMPMGHRISIPEYGGYLPIGYFQLWHGKHGRRYPLEQGSGEHSDVLHAMQWPTDKRRLIPEIVGVHLESEPSQLGANWSGRTTKRFGP